MLSACCPHLFETLHLRLGLRGCISETGLGDPDEAFFSTSRHSSEDTSILMLSATHNIVGDFAANTAVNIVAALRPPDSRAKLASSNHHPPLLNTSASAPLHLLVIQSFVHRLFDLQCLEFDMVGTP